MIRIECEQIEHTSQISEDDISQSKMNSGSGAQVYVPFVIEDEALGINERINHESDVVAEQLSYEDIKGYSHFVFFIDKNERIDIKEEPLLVNKGVLQNDLRVDKQALSKDKSLETELKNALLEFYLVFSKPNALELLGGVFNDKEITPDVISTFRVFNLKLTEIVEGRKVNSLGGNVHLKRSKILDLLDKKKKSGKSQIPQYNRGANGKWETPLDYLEDNYGEFLAVYNEEKINYMYTPDLAKLSGRGFVETLRSYCDAHSFKLNEFVPGKREEMVDQTKMYTNEKVRDMEIIVNKINRLKRSQVEK
ncbi:MAG: hypothetical protein OQK32_05565 [Gammaproteobacteria bacterium]|nr:hypothetical protein [Gammaproteobacteria bacterium]MCW8922397.1 hypothetical protein [Gammaproteobacteria bacterium]